MSLRRSGRLVDRAAADRLLDAAHAAKPMKGAARADPLAGLLAAAAAPARPEELAGEQAALAAFRAARAAPASAPARVPDRRSTAVALAWVAGIFATATAGAAFAAVTLDTPRETNPPPGPATPAPTTGHPGGSPTEGGAPTSGDRGGSPTAPSSPPSPSSGQTHTTPLGGLCRAHLAEQPDQRGKALKTPRFQPLVVAAGSAAQVEGYCQRLVPDANPGSKNGSGTGNGPGTNERGTKNGAGTGNGSGAGKKPAATAGPGEGQAGSPGHGPAQRHRWADEAQRRERKRA